MEDLKKVQELQVKQAEKALEEYKTHSEASTSKMFTQMKREVCLVSLKGCVLLLDNSVNNI